MRRLFVLCLLAASFAAAVGDPGAWFRKLDRNRDGYLDRKELAGQRRVLEVFGQADENGDGKLDAAEFIRAETLVQEMKRSRLRPSPEAAEPAKKEAKPG
jgi:hypothetical protein